MSAICLNRLEKLFLQDPYLSLSWFSEIMKSPGLIICCHSIRKNSFWIFWKIVLTFNFTHIRPILTSTAKQVLGNCERMVFVSFVGNFNFDSFNPNFLFSCAVNFYLIILVVNLYIVLVYCYTMLFWLYFC